MATCSGFDRLADLFERKAASTTLSRRRCCRLAFVQALLDYQGGGLRDDATLLLLRWA